MLEANHVSLARAKAQNLIEEDATGDLLEALEMHLGLILEHFQELEPRCAPSSFLSTCLISACLVLPRVPPYLSPHPPSYLRLIRPRRASNRIVRPFIHLRRQYLCLPIDLDGTRELLMQRLGNAFATSSAGGMDRHISPRVSWHVFHCN